MSYEAVAIGIDPLHRVENVAKELDVSRAQVYKLLASGEIRSLKIRGSRRIPESAIREFIAKGCELSRGRT
jgi:excisionase family DNA binding protein